MIINIEKGIGSQVALIEIDCAYNRYKNIYIESYDGQMAKGECYINEF